MSPSPWRLRAIQSLAVLVSALASRPDSSGAATVTYTPITETTNTTKAPPTNQFAVFNPTNIPVRRNDERGAFRVRLAYSSRDWVPAPAAPSPRRIPVDPAQFQHSLLGHRTAPVAVAVTLERVEAAADSDPLTLTKILRYSREAHAKFRVLGETTRRIGGVDGMETEYVQLRYGKLMRVRHWITHYNGVACQLQLLVPYEHPELMQIGGSNGFPLLVEFFDAERKRPVIPDSEVPRIFQSSYGYRVNLGEGDWIPGVIDPFIPAAEYVAYTRNQGGIAVVPLSTFGLSVETTPLLDALLAVAEMPQDRITQPVRRFAEGGLEGVSLEALLGNEEETIRMRVKAIRAQHHAYLAIAWINTNAVIAPGLFDQWLDKITITAEAAPYPTDAGTLGSFRERDRHAFAFWLLGEYYLAQPNLDRAAAALHVALESRFLPAILQKYVVVQHGRGHPEEIVRYIKSRGPLALAQGWVAMEFAFAQSQSGDTADALVHYTKCIASGSYQEATFPPRHFEDYIRCLAKEGRTKWAEDRLQRRLSDDDAPVWRQMLDQVRQNIVPLPSAPSALARASEAEVELKPAPESASPAKPVETGVPKLKSLIWHPTRPSAQLDNQLVFQGDSIRGYKVAKIEQSSVDLIAPDGSTLTLRMAP